MLSEIGATAFAGRAQGELLATCERVRKRTVDTFDELTAEETQIAYLARRRLHEPRNRGAAFYQSPHSGVAPAKSFRKARHFLSP